MFSLNLKNKNVFITGATRGIGRATAELYAQAGANLFLNARHEENLKAYCSELENTYSVSCTPLAFDVGQPQEVKAAFQTLIKQTKTLDVLINNAGILGDALIGMVQQSLIEQVYQTNVHSLYYLSQYAARLMQRQKSGSIINLTSIMAVQGDIGQSVYGGSKAAVIGITQSLAKELAEHNIRVNCVAPGFIDTEMTRQLPEDIYQQRIESIAMKRIGTPEDIAQVLLFLGSNLSSYMTGQVLGVDGGMQI